MKLSPEFNRRFLTNTDHTGRFIVRSFRTGVSYYVEPMGGKPSHWGDLNPATKKVEGSYGDKYRGAIDPEDSLITEDNGFKNIVVLEPGLSPLAYIDYIDAKKPDRVA